jgi:hypothetical protein
MIFLAHFWPFSTFFQSKAKKNLDFNPVSHAGGGLGLLSGFSRILQAAGNDTPL